MASQRTALLAATAAAATTAAGVGALAAAGRRWSAAHDPTGGEPLCLPDGSEELVETSDGAKLSTIVAGDGTQTFVLSHCWTGDRRVWGPVARRLVERGHRVVLYDHRGHGASTTGSEGYRLEVLADDLATVLRHVDARGAVVAGHSMGGMAAQAFAVEHPDVLRERVKALVLVATACDQLGRGAAHDAFALRAVASAAVDRVLGHQRLGPLFVRGSVGRRPAMTHLQAVVETFAATAPETRAGFLKAMSAMDFSEALAHVDLPVVVAVGSHDRLTPVSHSERLVEVLPGARLEVLADAGHMLPIEEPDRLADLLESVA